MFVESFSFFPGIKSGKGIVASDCWYPRILVLCWISVFPKTIYKIKDKLKWILQRILRTCCTLVINSPAEYYQQVPSAINSAQWLYRDQRNFFLEYKTIMIQLSEKFSTKISRTETRRHFLRGKKCRPKWERGRPEVCP